MRSCRPISANVPLTLLAEIDASLDTRGESRSDFILAACVREVVFRKRYGTVFVRPRRPGPKSKDKAADA